MPNRGLKKTQAMAMVKQLTRPPTTNAKTAAARVAAKPRSFPTRGIHFNKEIKGINRQKMPRIVKKIPARRMTMPEMPINSL